MRPSPLTTQAFALAEGPLWDPDRGTLFFTDIDAGAVYAVRDLAAGALENIHDGPRVGGLTLQHDGALLLFRENDIALLDPETREARSIVALDLHATDRCNDVLALPSGDVLFGTIGTSDTTGGVHLLTTSGEVTTLFTGTRIPNGMALSPTTAHLFYTDSTARTICRFPFDQRDRRLGEREIVHESSDDTPDGLAIDEVGSLYSARWGGSRVLKLDHEGHPREDIAIPTQNVTSVAFGGAGMRTMLITTAGGPVFVRENETPGIPEHRSRVIP